MHRNKETVGFCVWLSLFVWLSVSQGVYGAVAEAQKQAGKSHEKPLKERPLIVASIRPLALLAEELLRGRANIEFLVKGQASPHDYAMTIGQAMALHDAALILWVGPDFESFLVKSLKGKNALSMTVKAHHSHNDHHQHDHHASDPHLWLHNDELVAFSDRLSKKLVSLGILSEEEARENLRIFLGKLKASAPQIREQLNSVKSQPFIVFHDAYSGIVEEFGLNQRASLTKVPHEQIGAKRIASINRQLDNVHCLLAEQAESQMAERYAHILGLEVVLVDLLASDSKIQNYFNYLQSLSLAFEKCLSVNKLKN